MADEKAGAEWWKTTFGSESKVKRELFMEKYLAKVKTSDSYTVRVLAKYVIRGFENDDGNVLHDEFVNFIARFGPIDASFTKAKESLFDGSNYLLPWFHGALSREEAEKRLGASEAGHYLIRFSEKYPTKLTIMYTSNRDGQFHVKNILVHNSDKGFTLHDGVSGPDGSSEPPKYFSNLVALIDSFKNKLVKPVPSPILEYIKQHDQPGSKGHNYVVPDFTISHKDKDGRYTAFVDPGKEKSGASSHKADDKYSHFTGAGHERKASTGGHKDGEKHHADYTKFPGKDKDHLGVK